MKDSEADKGASGPLKDAFRQKLEPLKAAPSDQLWERLELSLDRQEAAQHKKLWRLYSRLAAAVLLLLLSAGSWLAYEQLQQKTPLAVQMRKRTAGSTQPDVASDQTVAHPASQGAPQEGSVPPLNAPNAEPDLSDSKASEMSVASAAAPVNASSGTQNSNLLALKPQIKKAVQVKTNNSQTVPASGVESARASITGRSESARAIISSLARSSLAAAKQGGGASPAVPTSASGQPEAGTTTARINPQAAGATTIRATARELAAASPPTSTKSTDSTQTNYTNSDPAGAVAAKVPAQTAETVPAAPDSIMPATVTVRASTDTVVLSNLLLRPQPRWLLAAAAAPVLFKQRLNLTQASPVPGVVVAQGLNSIPGFEAAASEFQAQTKSAFSYRAGLQAGYRILSSTWLTTGVEFEQMQAITHSTYKVEGVQRPSIMAVVDPLLPTVPVLVAALDSSYNLQNAQVVRTAAYDVRYRYSYFSFPLQVRQEFTVLGIEVFAAAGIRLHKLKEMEISTTSDSVHGRTYRPADGTFRKWLGSAELQAGVRQPLGKAWQLELAAAAGRGWAPVTQRQAIAGLVQGRPFAGSVSLSLQYRFP